MSMKRNIIKTALIASTIALSACTANYLEINSHPYQPDEDDVQTDGYAIGSALSNVMAGVISPDVNTTQFTECLLGGPMGGYLATSGNFSRTIDNYNAPDNWTNVFMASDRIIPVVYSNLAELHNVTDNPIALAIGEVVKVAAMHRVTDTYGPIPYSKIEVGGALQVEYDSQEMVYDEMFKDLDAAIETLTFNRTTGIPATTDYMYGGSAERWCRFANSLKLRLAMRIVYADPAKAQQMAEEAIASEVGVITSNVDNALMTQFGADGNPIRVAVNYNKPADSNTGGDTHVAADITSYMNALNDPRRAAYFVESEWEDDAEAIIPYVGMRRGIVIPALATVGRKYSGPKLATNTPIVWMNAAEVAFLRSEAALFGFNVGGTAQDLYNEGVRLSFEQWGTAGYDAYIAQSAPVAVTYVDPNEGTNSYGSVLTTLPVAWSNSDSNEQKQERIITQKWIANFILGNEAWADYRRTGYPKLIPATDAGNMSNGVVDSERGARRMPYPQNEYTTNSANIQAAVASYLKGPDNMATSVWWDCKPTI